jgi:hypothetical protein
LRFKQRRRRHPHHHHGRYCHPCSMVNFKHSIQLHASPIPSSYLALPTTAAADVAEVIAPSLSIIVFVDQVPRNCYSAIIFSVFISTCVMVNTVVIVSMSVNAVGNWNAVQQSKFTITIVTISHCCGLHYLSKSSIDGCCSCPGTSISEH